MRNDGRGINSGRPTGGRRGPPGPQRAALSRDDAAGWIWGWHAVEAALRNPARPSPERLLATAERARALAAIRPELKPEPVDPNEIARRLPQGAVHQGVAIRTPALDGVALDDIAEPARGVILMLDQVTDPQNVGAILRSAAAFGVRGVIVQDRHAPLLGGALAKAAAGALDRVAVVRAVNLSRALERLSDLGWRSIGLDSRADADISTVVNIPATVIVMGSEGEGLRRLVAEHCDLLARITMPGGFESLNVASAAAITLYAATLGPVARVSGE
jgi:23S rRNA (guanosine2251-2'-O)-methyltransferase